MKLANRREVDGFFFILLRVDLRRWLRGLVPGILLLAGCIINIRGLILKWFGFRVKLVGIHLIIVVLRLGSGISCPNSIGAGGSGRRFRLFIGNFVQL
jgi:hypothetical protein